MSGLALRKNMKKKIKFRTGWSFSRKNVSLIEYKKQKLKDKIRKIRSGYWMMI